MDPKQSNSPDLISERYQYTACCHKQQQYVQTAADLAFCKQIENHFHGHCHSKLKLELNGVWHLFI